MEEEKNRPKGESSMVHGESSNITTESETENQKPQIEMEPHVHPLNGILKYNFNMHHD